MSGMNANAGSLVLAAMGECRRLPAIGFVMQRVTPALPESFSEDQILNRAGEGTTGNRSNDVTSANRKKAGGSSREPSTFV